MDDCYTNLATADQNSADNLILLPTAGCNYFMEPVSAGIEEVYSKLNTYGVDFADVRGQEVPSGPS